MSSALKDELPTHPLSTTLESRRRSFPTFYIYRATYIQGRTPPLTCCETGVNQPGGSSLGGAGRGPKLVDSRPGLASLGFRSRAPRPHHIRRPAYLRTRRDQQWGEGRGVCWGAGWGFPRPWSVADLRTPWLLGYVKEEGCLECSSGLNLAPPYKKTLHNSYWILWNQGIPKTWPMKFVSRIDFVVLPR